eukprot:UN22064
MVTDMKDHLGSTEEELKQRDVVITDLQDEIMKLKDEIIKLTEMNEKLSKSGSEP